MLCALPLGLVPRAEAKRRGCPAGMVSVHGKFCIDAYEASVDVVDARGRTRRRQSPYHMPNEGERIRARSRRGVVPQAYISQEQAEAACEAAGKRLCTDDEWVEACKGRSPTLYPYGDEHQDGRCNDKGVSPLRKLHGAGDGLDVFGIEAMNDPRLNKVPGSLARTGQFRRCRNSFGAYDMVGNLHEWTANPTGVFRGGYYLDNELHGRGCSYLTTGHNTKYHDYSIGFRCCSGGAGDAQVKKQAPKKKPANGKTRTHVVESGESLWGIAKKYGVSVSDICEASKISPEDPLQPGQELTIPPG
ncbi:MAG: SUMF1/EgtB/PvdO family nonheme iron enzyme [Polyangiaceae bacterium]|nr:SUMF1/EgtB/PvdO family nonheme iron enzyme [Polyangiaceae bacterium]